MTGWVQRTFSDYDMPAGRTPESFPYRVESSSGGLVVDVYYMDTPEEAARMVEAETAQGYEVRLHINQQD